MARKDLAGLAALGALGMMLSKRKGSAGADVDPESADRANAISRGRTDLVDTGMSTPEPGERARLDENYGNEGRRTGPVGVGKTPSAGRRASAASGPSLVSPEEGMRNYVPRRMPATPQANSTTEEGMRNYVPRRTPQANSTTEEGMRNYVSRAPTDTAPDTAQADRVRNLASAFNVPMRQRLSEDGVPYKKGGAVKKMAKGGMASSASKRADGIATKGKTRGKMC